MDPASLALTAATFVATAIARHARDDLTKLAWERIKAAVTPLLGREARPDDLARPEIRVAVASDADLASALSEFWEQSGVLRRAHLVGRVLAGARVLWVDDHPEGNVLERECLASLGVDVTAVETTRSALACLGQRRVDLIVSDVARGDSAMEGLDAVPQLRAAAPGVPVVFYVFNLERGGPPSGTFGITNRPDELLHLCMDALERTRAPSA